MTDEVDIYSNVHAFRLIEVEEIGINSVIFALKPIKTDNQQYILIEEKNNPQSKLSVNIKTHQGKVKDGVSVTDFIETFNHKSVNTYEF